MLRPASITLPRFHLLASLARHIIKSHIFYLKRCGGRIISQLATWCPLSLQLPSPKHNPDITRFVQIRTVTRNIKIKPVCPGTSQSPHVKTQVPLKRGGRGSHYVNGQARISHNVELLYTNGKCLLDKCDDEGGIRSGGRQLYPF